jgi:hypothetical protein
MASKHKMITAVFRDRVNAQSAFDWLQYHGYTSGEINVMMSDQTRKLYETSDTDEKVSSGTLMTEGVATGGAIGTAVGATLGAIAAIGTSVAIPGLGMIVAGPIVAALAGGGAGAVAGGLIGGLIGLGIPESNARAYELALREGGVAIGVVPHSDDDADAIRKRFEELEGENIVIV